MAENSAGSENVNQDKVKTDAQNIAAGNPTANTGETATTGQQGLQSAQAAPSGNMTGASANPNALSDNNKTGASQNATQRGADGKFAAKSNFVGPDAINQSNPGAAKPGAAAAQPTAQPLSPEEAETKLHNDLVRQFGPDYVRAEKSGGDGKPSIVTTFSRVAWDMLGANKEGYKAVVRKPQEVTDLEAQRAQNAQA
jgi:hypothetical protein